MERPLPYSDWCYVCGKDNPHGFRIVFTTEDGRVRARFTADPHRQGYLGVTHGGVVSTLLDETMGWVPSLVTRRMYVTGELTVRYLTPLDLGEDTGLNVFRVGKVLLMTPKRLQRASLASEIDREMKREGLTLDDLLGDLKGQRKRYLAETYPED